MDRLLWEVYRHASNYKLQGLALWVCVAAVEMALLELMGQTAKRPLADFFGGTLRRDISIYVASGNRGNSPEAEIEHLQKLVAESGARALSSFELAESLLEGNDLRRERVMILFKLAAAAHATELDSRAIEAYDDIIRFTQDTGDARLDGLARSLRGQVTFQRGSQRHGIEQMILGATRLHLSQSPEAKRSIELVREHGSRMQRKEYEALIKDLCERRELREALL